MAATHEGHVKTFNRPDEVREFAAGHGHTDAVNLDGRTVTLSRFEPGWRWSVDVGPIAGTATCQVEHFGYCLSGRMRIHMDGGETLDVGPGDVAHIMPGHDAETIGGEPALFVDFGDVSHYAKR